MFFFGFQNFERNFLTHNDYWNIAFVEINHIERRHNCGYELALFLRLLKTRNTSLGFVSYIFSKLINLFINFLSLLLIVIN